MNKRARVLRESLLWQHSFRGPGYDFQFETFNFKTPVMFHGLHTSVGHFNVIILKTIYYSFIISYILLPHIFCKP